MLDEKEPARTAQDFFDRTGDKLLQELSSSFRFVPQPERNTSSKLLENQSALGKLSIWDGNKLPASQPGAPTEQTPKSAELQQQNKLAELAHKQWELGQQKNVLDTSKPFVEVDPMKAANMLATPPSKEIPPVAERFEQDALAKLGPEPSPTIYVSKDGKNVPTGATKYTSITEALRHATAGSVIQVGPGVYNERVKLAAKHSKISIQTDRHNPAIIKDGGFNIGDGAHDLSIRNFDVRNFSGYGAGILIDGSNIKNITIAGNNVHDARITEGIAVYGRPGSGVNNVNIIGNRVHGLILGQLEAMPINGNVDGFTIIGNSGYEMDNLFIDVIGGEGNGGNKDQPRNGVIAYNFADGISSTENPEYDGYSAAAIYSDGGRNLDIYGNYVRNSDFGIEIGSEHRGLNSSHVQVHNNIIEKSITWLKLGYKGGVDNSTVRDNLVLNNSLSDVEREGPVSSSTVKVDGNIRASDRNHITKIPAKIAAFFYRTESN